MTEDSVNASSRRCVTLWLDPCPLELGREPNTSPWCYVRRDSHNYVTYTIHLKPSPFYGTYVLQALAFNALLQYYSSWLFDCHYYWSSVLTKANKFLFILSNISSYCMYNWPENIFQRYSCPFSSADGGCSPVQPFNHLDFIHFTSSVACALHCGSYCVLWKFCLQVLRT